MSGAETMRPTAPDACDHCDTAPRCGCGIAYQPPTVPAPGPCQEQALADLLMEQLITGLRIKEASLVMDREARGRAVRLYEAERDRLMAMRTAD